MYWPLNYLNIVAMSMKRKIVMLLLSGSRRLFCRDIFIVCTYEVLDRCMYPDQSAPKKLRDLDLRCLPFFLHPFDTVMYGRFSLFRDNYIHITGVNMWLQNSDSFLWRIHFCKLGICQQRLGRLYFWLMLPGA